MARARERSKRAVAEGPHGSNLPRVGGRCQPRIERGPAAAYANGTVSKVETIDLRAPEAFFNRELSWLNFARRVLAQVEDERLPLVERIHFAGIMGMLHDEFFMKRISGLKRQIAKGTKKLSLDGKTPAEEFDACIAEMLEQQATLAAAIADELLPLLAEEGSPILLHRELSKKQKRSARDYFERAVEPILTPLAVDAEHPFPFISHGNLNLAVVLVDRDEPDGERFVRIKVPDNRPRWVALPDGEGFVPLEQVIAANIDLLFPDAETVGIYPFRVTRAASGDRERFDDDPSEAHPGSLVRMVSNELKARRFAGVVRLQVTPEMPKKRVKWLARQLEIDAKRDVYRDRPLLVVSDLASIELPGRPELSFPPHLPVRHPRLAELGDEPAAIFEEIERGDVLLQHPYQRFDDSVLRFIEAAAVDPAVLAIKLTIYRTGADSPIVRALAEASRRGKQVAVAVEITARFDEAPNIAWANYLESEGCHVSFGVEQLKTHVKLALVIREQGDEVRRFAHVGTGNYNVRTARIYEDLGLLTADADICREVARIFNELTGAGAQSDYRNFLVAPRYMRKRFVELIRREAEHAEAGRPSGIVAKMNQLQDPEIIRELYRAGRAGVPITLNVRGLCCLRPGVPGLSETIRVYGVVGRFLEHSRVYRFVNGGDEEFYLGSADWMKRNLDRRVETIVRVADPDVRSELAAIFECYERDNSSVWDCGPDGRYTRRRPAEGEHVRAVQPMLALRAARMERPGEEMRSGVG